MAGFRKRPRLLAAAAAACLAAGAAVSEEAPSRLDGLLEDLAAAETENWRGVEAEIMRVWSQSGSDAMDFLLRRGRDAIEEGDYAAAVEHLSALTDHAPDFAEGWNARATAFYLMGEHGLALDDLERVLRLNPRHFMAMGGLAIILEGMGELQLALEASRAARALNPHRNEMNQTVSRLERMLGEAEL